MIESPANAQNDVLVAAFPSVLGCWAVGLRSLHLRFVLFGVQLFYHSFRIFPSESEQTAYWEFLSCRNIKIDSHNSNWYSELFVRIIPHLIFSLPGLYLFPCDFLHLKGQIKSMQAIAAKSENFWWPFVSSPSSRLDQVLWWSCDMLTWSRIRLGGLTIHPRTSSLSLMGTCMLRIASTLALSKSWWRSCVLHIHFLLYPLSISSTFPPFSSRT